MPHLRVGERAVEIPAEEQLPDVTLQVEPGNLRLVSKN
jgi:hypothetical protein